MKKKKQINWHEIIQEILEEHLPLMSGKRVQDLARERPHYFKVDYYCAVKGILQDKKKTKQIRPFEHLKARNVIEYKSVHEVLNEGMFRNYVARTLMMERINTKKNYQGEMTLTILTTHKPKGLLQEKAYGFNEIYPWKYESNWIKDLEIYILVLREIEDPKGGEALALLQVLEGEKKQQEKKWKKIFHQDLENIFVLKKLIEKINKEAAVNLAEHYKLEGKLEGEIKGLLKSLSWTAPELVKKYEKEIKEAKTEEALKKLIEKINKEAAVNLAEYYKLEGKLEGLLKALNWTAPELVKKYEKEIKEAKTEEALKKLEEKLKKELAKK